MTDNWKTIEDAKVRHIWKDVETGDEVIVSPDWYEDNGTPIGESGDDMVYVRTEILID